MRKSNGRPLKLPPNLAGYLNDFAIWGNETREDVANVFNSVIASLRPRDGIDWILVKSITELVLEVNRYRRFKWLIMRHASKPVGQQINPTGVNSEEEATLNDHEKANALLSCLPHLQEIEKMLASAKARMAGMLREYASRKSLREIEPNKLISM